MTDAAAPDARAFPRLGVRLHGGISARECLDYAQTADQVGFDGVWFAENAFARGAMAAATLCAAGTQRIQIGAGVFNPFSRHPSLIAMEIGALDEVSGGRTSLCIGAGFAGAIERMGFSYDKPLSAVRDAVAIIRGLFRGESVRHEGAVFSAKDVRLEYPSRADIAIHVAGRGERTLRFCGAAADGWVVSNMCAPGFIAAAAETLVAAASKAGRVGAPSIVRYAPCAVNEDSAAAVLAAKHAIAEMLPAYVALSRRVPTVAAGLTQGSGVTAEEFEQAAVRLRAGEDPGMVLDERVVAAFAIAGTPEECLSQARAQRAMGVTDLALTFSGPGSHEEMRRLAEATRR